MNPSPSHSHGHSGHDHDHAHDGHSHGPHAHDHAAFGHGASSQRLFWALGLVLVFMILEIVTGWIFHSLALLSDGVHMLSDAASLGLAGAASVLSRRRASTRRTYGYKRVEVLAAFANALSLLWLCLWLGYEAIDRLRHPLEVQGRAVFVVALAGLIVNVALLFWLHHGEGERTLNEEGVIWHVIGDTLSSVAAVAAGALLMWTGWTWADPLLALLVVIVLLLGAGKLLMRSSHILVEGVPLGLDTAAVRADLLAQPQVAAVHDLHLWTLDGRDLYASAHVATHDGNLTERDVAKTLTRLLTERHHFDHVTLQVGHCQDDNCGAHCDFK